MKDEAGEGWKCGSRDNVSVGLTVKGLDVIGNVIEANIEAQTCDGVGGCSFARTVTAVPEPASVAMMLLGLVGVAGVARRRVRSLD